MTHGEELINMKVLMVDDELSAQTASGRAPRALIKELCDRDVAVIEATSDADGQAVVLSDPSLEGILLDWTLGDDDCGARQSPDSTGVYSWAQYAYPDLPHRQARRCIHTHR